MMYPDISTSETLAVTATADLFDTEMLPHNYYRYVCTVASYIQTGTEPEAEAAAGSMFVPANSEVILDGRTGPLVSVIRASGDGVACITRFV